MDVTEAIEKRRAYRSLEPVEITNELIDDLVKHAQLAPSCFNNQPTRFIFVYSKEMLRKLHAVLSSGNVWATDASMIIALFGKKDADCILKNIEYYLFDIGQATAFLQLRATELGLVAHPIAGFNEERAKEILHIPSDMTIITLVIIGKKSELISDKLSENQITNEKQRPERLVLENIIYRNRYN
jgi:nitroreductase